MSKLAGYVIVRGQEPDVEVFEGFRFAPEDGHAGNLAPKVSWGKPFLGRGVERFALYKDHIEAEQARQYPPLHSARVEPLIIGSDTKSNNYEKLQDAADAEMEDEAHLSMTPGHDEAAAQIFARDSAWPHNEGGIVSELFNTGSVTVQVGGKTWTVWLEAQEEA